MLTDFAILGIAIFFGLLCGKLFDRVGIPEVVGIVLIGVVMGESILGYIPSEKLEYYKPLADLALSFFGFFIGAELNFSKLKKLGFVIISILVFEALVTFISVFSFIYLLTESFFMAILLASLAVSTAPAATADVIWENRAAGDLTTTILALIGLDDIIAVLVFSLTSTLVYNSLGEVNGSYSSTLFYFIDNIGVALVIGFLFGLVIVLIARVFKKRRDFMIMAIGLVILASGVTEFFNASEIITTLIIGMLFSNYCKHSDPAINALRELSAPLFTIFFVLIGARLNFTSMYLAGIISIVYIASAMMGKTAGATLGAYVSKASENIKRNIGFSLYSQAGLALGLASKLYYDLLEFGETGRIMAINITNVVISAAIFLLIIGPITLKYALDRADEAGKITREEIVFD